MVIISVAFIMLYCIVTPISFAESITNVYDDLNRLIRTEYGDGTALTYDYDEVGNRTTKYIRPTACTNLPTRILATPPVYYPTFLAVYTAATGGATIQAMNTSLNENVNFNRSISVILNGGYICDYSSTANYTTINGAVTITSGTVTVNNIIVQ